MDEKLQNKINLLKEFAKSSGKIDPSPQRRLSPTGDSLSRVIRSEKEAEVFLAELNAVIAMAKTK